MSRPSHRVVSASRTALPRGWRRPLAALALTATVLSGAAVAAQQHGYATEQRQLSGGGVWLPSRAVGQLSLLDGQSGQVAAQVQVSAAGDDTHAVQAGSDAYVVNRTRGTLIRVDGAYQTPSAQVVVLPGAGERLQAFATADALYVFDGKRGLLQRADPHTMALIGEPVGLAATPGDEGAVIDAAGTMWLVDTSGTLLRFAGSGVTRKGGLSGGARLVRVGDRVALLEPGVSQARLLDPQSTSFAASACYDTGNDITTRVAGDHASSRLYTVSGARGVLQTIDLSNGQCPITVPRLAAPGDVLSDPIENGGRLFVPDTSTGEVLIVDLLTRTVVAKPAVLAAGTDFHLLSKDNTVYFNDPESDQAGVVRVDGSVSVTHKYDRAHPAKGVSSGPGGVTADSARQPTAARLGRPGTPNSPIAPIAPSAPAGRARALPAVPSAAATPSAPAGPSPTASSAPTPSPPDGSPTPSVPPTPSATPSPPPTAAAAEAPSTPTPGGAATGAPTPSAPVTPAGSGQQVVTVAPSEGSRSPAPALTPTPSPSRTPTAPPTVRIRYVGAPEVTFTLESTGGAVPRTAEWTFEPRASASGLTVTHTFASAGTYRVVAQVTLESGQALTASADVQVVGPTRQFSVAVDAPTNGRVVSTGGEINCPSVCSASFSSTATLSAVPKTGWRVASWGGGCAGTVGNTCELNDAANVSVAFTVSPGALVFSDPSQVATVPTVGGRGSNSSWTVELWVKPTSLISELNIDPAIVAGITGPSTPPAFSLLLHNSSNETKDACIEVRLDLPTTVCMNSVILMNTWQHIAAVYNGSELLIYKNACMLGHRPATGSMPTYGQIRLNSPRGTGDFRGSLAGLTVWDSARTVEEIRLDAAGVAAPEPGLFAHWFLNDGTGRVLNDQLGRLAGTLGYDPTDSSFDPTWDPAANPYALIGTPDFS